MSAHLGSASCRPIACSAPPQAARPDGWLGLLRRILRTAETRQDLLEADDFMLRDVGLTRTEAAAEANRAPWDLPPQRL